MVKTAYLPNKYFIIDDTEYAIFYALFDIAFSHSEQLKSVA